jgi:hypothetical protein
MENVAQLGTRYNQQEWADGLHATRSDVHHQDPLLGAPRPCGGGGCAPRGGASTGSGRRGDKRSSSPRGPQHQPTPRSPPSFSRPDLRRPLLSDGHGPAIWGLVGETPARMPAVLLQPLPPCHCRYKVLHLITIPTSV